MYSFRNLSRNLLKRYSAKGSKVQLTQYLGFPNLTLLNEEANSIATDTILGCYIGAAAKVVKTSLQEDQENELTHGNYRLYYYSIDLNL